MEQKNYFISVAEPWDFKGLDGANIIRGQILSIKSKQCLVFKSNNIMEFGIVKGNFLILSSRHYDVDYFNLNDKNLTFNGGVLLNEYDENLSEKELKENSKFVIIGSIHEE